MRSVPFALGTTQPAPINHESPSPPITPRSSAVPLPVKILPAQKIEDFNDSFDEQQETQAAPVPELLEKPLKFRVPRSERNDVMRLVSRLSEQLQTSVEWSHVGRALVVL